LLVNPTSGTHLSSDPVSSRVLDNKSVSISLLKSSLWLAFFSVLYMTRFIQMWWALYFTKWSLASYSLFLTFRSIWGFCKWSQMIPHSQKPGYRHQNQVSSYLQIKVMANFMHKVVLDLLQPVLDRQNLQNLARHPKFLKKCPKVSNAFGIMLLSSFVLLHAFITWRSFSCIFYLVKNVKMTTAGNQEMLLKCCIVEMQSCHAVICQVLMLITGTFWTTFVFMSMLKSHFLWLFVMLSCHAVMLSCHALMLSYVKCLCWSLGHAEQLLFSCLCSKVTVYDCLSCCHVMQSCCHMSSAYVDHWDMLNNFCFHVYSQKSLFMIVCHAVICQLLMLITGTCWTTFVFMSMLKSHCLWPKIAMCFFWQPPHPPVSLEFLELVPSSGVDILQIGSFSSPTSNWRGTFSSPNFPGSFYPHPHFKCKTHQIWPTLKWNYSFFINF